MDCGQGPINARIVSMKTIPVESDEPEDAPPALQENTEVLRLSLKGVRRPFLSYLPDAAPHRFAISDEDEDQGANRGGQDDVQTEIETLAQPAEDSGWIYALAMVVVIAWIAATIVFDGSPALTVIQDMTETALPGLVILFGLGGIYLFDRQEKRRLLTWQRALGDVFSIEDSKLTGKAREAKSLARSLSEVQLQMRGVNTQFWVLQKNIGDITQLKTDLEFLGQEISTFSTVSRRTIMDWETQLSQAGAKLAETERTTARLSHESMETCSFLSDRLEEASEQIESLSALQQAAADGTEKLTGTIRNARDDMKDMIDESIVQSEEAAQAQRDFRNELKAHVADLSKELFALGNMAKAFDGVRADMSLAAQVLSRGVRESLIDVKLMLEDWKETKSQLETVLGHASDKVSREFDAQLIAARQFLSEWDHLLNSRVSMLTQVQDQIQKQLDLVPQSLQEASKSVLREAPQLIDRMEGFRHATAGLQMSIQEAKLAAEQLSAVAPDLSGFKSEITALSDKASTAKRDLSSLLAQIAPEMRALDGVTIRAENFFRNLQDKSGGHVEKLKAVEDVLERLKAPGAVKDALSELQPLLTTVERLNERCGELEKRAASAREQFEAVDLKPLMKSLVLQIESVFDISIDVLTAVKPAESALKHRDDLPALTIRLRQILENVKPHILASNLKAKPALHDSARKFITRFSSICEEARTSSPQGEWVATALASSELGKIYRLLSRALEVV